MKQAIRNPMIGMRAMVFRAKGTPREVSQEGLQLTKWPYFLYVVVVGTVIPFGLYFQGIKYIGGTRAPTAPEMTQISAKVAPRHTELVFQFSRDSQL